MRVVFRADASHKIGSGHIMRCLTLAEGLRESGAEIEFVCRKHSGNLNELISGKNFIVHELSLLEVTGSQTTDSDTKNKYVRWPGVSQKQDANDTITALVEKQPEWLIVDHYGLDNVWEKKVRPHVGNIMVIDDLANRHHHCVLLLD